MKPKETKYCAYCGKKISADAERCVHCGEWLNESSISRNHTSYSYTSKENTDEENEDLGYIPNKRVENNPVTPSNSYNNTNMHNRGVPTEYSKILPMRRLFLLMVFTLGLYVFYWVYKTNCYLRDDLGKDVSPGLRTFLLIIPIASIIVLYQTFEDINQFIKREGIETYSSGLNILLLIFSNFIPFIGIAIPFWVYINVQESINEFWRIKEPNLPIKREFSNSEIVVMVLGIIFWTIFFVFYIVLLAYSGSMV